MAKKTTLTVATDIGTFHRTTARTYTHVVVAKGVRAEVLENNRLAAIKNARREVAEYAAVVAGVRAPLGSLTVAEYAERFLPNEQARLAALLAEGPITEDRGTDWQVLGWCGRLDLAAKLAQATGRVEYYDSAARFRHVRVFAVADGSEVLNLRKGD